MRALKITKTKELYYLDQRMLPEREEWRISKTLAQGYTAIKQLRVRGAPLIGVFAAYSLAISAEKFPNVPKIFATRLINAISYLKSARPTAVNLFWALDRMENVFAARIADGPKVVKQALLKEARAIHTQDIQLCDDMARHGVRLIDSGNRILTHCNTGFLAASGVGTALGVILAGHKKYGDISVYVDETRPLLQGARLTAWELMKMKVPCKLITDNMAAYCMSLGLIDKVFLGADRITANGDVANKIGTYNVAVAAKYHNVPFYVVAPFSTFDLSLKTGQDIDIEQRAFDEVRKARGKVVLAPKNIDVYNPAFDITPARLITAIVTDRGIIYPPFKSNIKKMLND